MPYSTVDEIRDSGLARPIPIYSTHTTRKRFPIVGTSLDYFEFRQFRLAQGNSLVTIGDCVIGAAVAQELGVGVGESLLSDSNNVVNLAGQYPLKMIIRGVLEPTQTPDDWAVFVDLKTSWIIDGLGHGHNDVTKIEDEEMVVRGDDGSIMATPAVLPYLEITDANMDSFHFHGELDDFPISSVIAVAANEKNQTILEGRFVGSEDAQIVSPRLVIEELMDLVFKVKRFFDANAVLIAVSTFCLLSLVVLLSLRLRQREMETMFKLGCSRGTILRLLIGEMGLIFLVSGGLVGLAVWSINSVANDVVQSLLIGS